MEIDPTISEASVISVAATTTRGVPRAEQFGTRPPTGRPHSISLFASPRAGGRDGASRGVDILVGFGLGAALMYYLDRERGPRRRDALGAALGELALTIISRGVGKR